MNFPLVVFVVTMILLAVYGVTGEKPAGSPWRSHGGWLLPFIALAAIGWTV